MKELVYNVFYEDINHDQIRTMNIFEGEDLNISAVKRLAEAVGHKATFFEALRCLLLYRYGNRCECEVVITGWPNGNTNRKVDIYEQVMLNWPLICDYVWREINEDICSE